MQTAAAHDSTRDSALIHRAVSPRHPQQQPSALLSPRPPRIRRMAPPSTGSRDKLLLMGLVGAVLWVNCRYTLHIIQEPYNPFSASTSPAFLPRHKLAKGTDDVTPAGVASLLDLDDDLVSHAVAIERAFEFANLSSGNALADAVPPTGGGDGTGGSGAFGAYYQFNKNRAPDSVHEQTMSYPAWVHQATLLVPYEYLQRSSTGATAASPAPGGIEQPTLPTVSLDDAAVQDPPTDAEALKRLCDALQFAVQKQGSVGSLVLDAGWWAPDDMFAPNPHLLPVPKDPSHSRSLLRRLLSRCELDPKRTAKDLPLVLPWISPLVPVTDIRYRIGSARGYFIHSGEPIPTQQDAAPGDEVVHKPNVFRWYRKGVVRPADPETLKEGPVTETAPSAASLRTYRDYVIEGALLDFSNPAAVQWLFRDPTYGLYALLAAFDDVAGVRCGGVDVLIKEHGSNPHISGGRLYGKSGAVSPSDYSQRYYTEVYHGGHNIVSKLKKLASLDGGASDLRREFVMMARTVDSHNQRHYFHRFGLPDITGLGFTGDHSLTYGDLRNSALNVIHSTYHCFPNVGSVLGRKGEQYATALRGGASGGGVPAEGEGPRQVDSVGDHSFREVEEASIAFERSESWPAVWKQLSNCPSTKPQVAQGVEQVLTDRWHTFSSLMPVLYISPESVRLIGGTELDESVSRHNALAPYFAANTKRSQLFDFAALHVQTDANSAFKYYHNAHGNPYCALRYIPSFYHRMFAVDAIATLNTTGAIGASGAGFAIKQYARSRSLSRNDLPHVLFQPPLTNYQFAIGPDMLVVPSLSPSPSVAGDPPRRVSFPLPQASPGLDLRSCHVASYIDGGGMTLPEVLFARTSANGISVISSEGSGAQGESIRREVIDSSMWINARRLYREGMALAKDAGRSSGVYVGLTAEIPSEDTTSEGAILTRRGSLIPLSILLPNNKEAVVFASELPLFCGGGAVDTSTSQTSLRANVTAGLVSVLGSYYSYKPSFKAMSSNSGGMASPQDFILDRVGEGARYKSSIPFSYTHWMGAKMVLNGVAVGPSGDRVVIARYLPTSTDLPLDSRSSRFSAQTVALSVVLPPTKVANGNAPATTVECVCQWLPPAGLEVVTGVPPSLPSARRVACQSVSSPERDLSDGGFHKRHMLSAPGASEDGEVRCALEANKGDWRRLVLRGSALRWWSCACAV